MQRLGRMISATDQRLENATSEIHRPTFARLRPPLPQDLPLPPRSQASDGGMEQIGRRNSLMKPECISEIAEEASK